MSVLNVLVKALERVQVNSRCLKRRKEPLERGKDDRSGKSLETSYVEQKDSFDLFCFILLKSFTTLNF